ncbi:potassium channel family protein [Streptomyces sp. RKAG337]|uniref:potassium channel family protein n=1 Tax=Streptomyces sp. RKAG337 TaxID=2893404 RepID=UPI0020333F7F|nr:potassium channel family protein [Streptomyces sp. RKAG337]MCM2425470.1 ion channel [Streptomyces sp. RKAG337]
MVGKGDRRRVLLAVLRCLATAGVLVTAYYLLPLASAFTPATIIALIGGTVAVALLLLWQARAITRSTQPTLRAVQALATTLPLFLLLCAVAYYLLQRSAPESFDQPLSRTDTLYFTMTVFSTVGFGDISPHSQLARLLTTGQMTIDLLLIGLAAKVLAGAVQEGLRRQSHAPTNSENGRPPTAP